MHLTADHCRCVRLGTHFFRFVPEAGSVTEPKCCPWCGPLTLTGGRTQWWEHADDCYLEHTIPLPNSNQAIKEWNTRHVSDERREMVLQLNAFVRELEEDTLVIEPHVFAHYLRRAAELLEIE